MINIGFIYIILIYSSTTNAIFNNPPNYQPFSDVGQFWRSGIQQMNREASKIHDSLRRFFPETRNAPPPQPPTATIHKDPSPHEFIEGAADLTPPHYDAGFYDGVPSSFENVFHSFGLTPIKPKTPRPVWWQGPNVCVTKEIDEEVPSSTTEKNEETGEEQRSSSSSFSGSTTTFTFGMNGGQNTYKFTSCQQTPNKYSCTTEEKVNGTKKRETTTRQCCQGYHLETSDGIHGSCEKLNLVDIVQTSKQLGAQSFADAIEKSGIEYKTLNITVFAPTDLAINEYHDRLYEKNNIETFTYDIIRRRRHDIEVDSIPYLPGDKELVLSHMVEGIVDVAEISNEEVYESKNKNNTKIRINTWYLPSSELFFIPSQNNRIYTANCVPLTREKMAENGVVFTIDKVLLPVTRTLADLITDNPNLSTFKKILDNSGSWDDLSDTECSHKTIFAPTNDAFERLPHDVLQRLLDGEGCVNNVALNHMVEQSICSVGLQGEGNLITMTDEQIHFRRVSPYSETVPNSVIHINNGQIIKFDNVAKNGILHIVDVVLLPKSARSLTEVLEERGLTSYLKLLQKQKSLNDINMLQNVTIFAPTELALTQQQLSEDDAMYHITEGEIKSCEFENNKIMESMATDNKLRMNLFKTMPTFGVGPSRATVQCARVVNIDEAACGVIVHELDRAIKPPVGDIMTTLEKQGVYNKFVELIRGTKYETILAEEDEISLLAVPDEIMKGVSDEVMLKLASDATMREQVLAKHVVREIICCNAIATPVWPFSNRVRTDIGTVTLNRGRDGSLIVGTIPIRTCDTMATNGVIHAVSHLSVGNPPRVGNNNREQSYRFKNPRLPNVNVEIFGV